MRYEYRCCECRAITAKDFPLAKNPARVVCATCGGEAIRAFTSMPPVALKGSGWASKKQMEPMDPKTNRVDNWQEPPIE